MGLARHVKIGDSSGTIHAETAAILKARITDGANIYVTDLFCPNCAKKITESGIKNVYIDHKGFDKDFAQRRTVDFNVVHAAMQTGRVSVYRLNRKERIIEALFEAPEDFVAEEEKPGRCCLCLKYRMNPCKILWRSLPVHRAVNLPLRWRRNMALKRRCLIALMLGASALNMMEQDRRMIENNSGKYSYSGADEPHFDECGAVRLSILNGYIYSAHVPTSREQVNMLGAVDRYFIDQTGADDNGHAALQMLSDHNVVTQKTPVLAWVTGIRFTGRNLREKGFAGLFSSCLFCCAFFFFGLFQPFIFFGFAEFMNFVRTGVPIDHVASNWRRNVSAIDLLRITTMRLGGSPQHD